jgi:hypothetical protein
MKYRLQAYMREVFCDAILITGDGILVTGIHERGFFDEIW